MDYLKKKYQIKLIIKKICKINSYKALENNKEAYYITKNMELPIFHGDMKNISYEDILIDLYLSAIDFKNSVLLDYLVDNSINGPFIISEIYNRRCLSYKRLSFIIKNNNTLTSYLIRIALKEENQSLLDTILKNLKFYDNFMIIKFLKIYQNKKPLSNIELRKMVLDKYYRFVVDNSFSLDKYMNYACKIGNEKMLIFLLKYGFETNRENESGDTPLIVSCRNNKEKMVRYLIKYNSNINKEDKNGDTPLMIACINKNEDMVQYLLQHGANVYKINDLGDTALIIACKIDSVSIVEKLINFGSNINTVNNNKETALMVACMNGNEEIVKRLVEANADLNIENRNNEPALTIAYKYGYVDI
eukprot:jgi/Orpsp1_1/1179273/evm.model.c7180000068703.1